MFYNSIRSHFGSISIAPAIMAKRKAESLSTRTKHERLCELGKESFVSQSGLSKLMTSIRDSGLPESFSRSSQYRARKDMCYTMTPYGPLLHKVELKQRSKPNVVVGFQNPMAFMSYSCEHSDMFARIMGDALRASFPTPAAPWTIILYQDGVDPGDGLVKNKSRHSVVFHWSFVEFGMDALSHEEVWGTTTVVRTRVAKQLNGGVTELAHRVVEQFHGDIYDFRRTGVVTRVKGDDIDVRIFANVHLILADLPALAEILSSKGHNGLKPCPLCMNATHHKPPSGAAPMHLYSEYCVPISDTNFANFKRHSDASLRQMINRLNECKLTLSNTELEKMETNIFGYTWTAWSIIANARFGIDAATSVMFDWPHCYVSDGIADQEFGCFMKCMHTARTQQKIVHPCSYQNVAEYMGAWLWPKCRGNPMHLFDANRAARFIRSGDFASTASEFLTICPVLRRFLICVVQPSVLDTPLIKYVESMIAVLEVVEVLQACKIKDFVNADDLHALIKKHLDAFKAAWGEPAMRLKHHCALHLADILKRFGFLLGVLTNERKHRAFKRYARGRTSTESFDLCVLEEMTCHNMWELGHKFWNAFSTSKPSRQQLWWLKDMFPDGGLFTLHNEVRFNVGGITAGDVVAFEWQNQICIGELFINVGIAYDTGTVEMYSIVSKWDKAPEVDPSETGVNMLVRDQTIKITSKCLKHAFTYRMANDRSSCFVLIPYEFISKI